MRVEIPCCEMDFVRHFCRCVPVCLPGEVGVDLGRAGREVVALLVEVRA